MIFFLIFKFPFYIFNLSSSPHHSISFPRVQMDYSPAMLTYFNTEVSLGQALPAELVEITKKMAVNVFSLF